MKRKGRRYREANRLALWPLRAHKGHPPSRNCLPWPEHFTVSIDPLPSSQSPCPVNELERRTKSSHRVCDNRTPIDTKSALSLALSFSRSLSLSPSLFLLHSLALLLNASHYSDALTLSSTPGSFVCLCVCLCVHVCVHLCVSPAGHFQPHTEQDGNN